MRPREIRLGWKRPCFPWGSMKTVHREGERIVHPRPIHWLDLLRFLGAITNHVSPLLR